MDENPYQSPRSTEPPTRGVVVATTPTIAIGRLCPVCGHESDNIKVRWVLERAYFLIVIYSMTRRFYVACPRCMRRIIWRRCFANLLPGNVVWLFYILPYTIVCDFATRLGPKRRVPAAVVPYLEQLMLLAILAIIIGAIYVAVSMSN